MSRVNSYLRAINLGLAAAVASCAPSKDPAAAGDKAPPQGLENAWQKDVSEARVTFDRRFVLPACGQPGVTERVRCGLIHKVYESDQFRDDFAAKHCTGASVSNTSACSDKLVGEFIRVIEQRYHVRFIDLCKGGKCASFLETELRALRNNNRQATGDYDYRLQVIGTNYERRIGQSDAQRGLADRMKGVTAEMRDYAETLERRSLVSRAYAEGLLPCGGDRACGDGRVCVELPDSREAVCARRLNAIP
jgi:hypothetical protein